MLKKTHRIQLKIELLSGMHITGGDDTLILEVQIHKLLKIL